MIESNPSTSFEAMGTIDVVGDNVNISFWCFELLVPDRRLRPSAEWVEEYFESYTADALLRLLNLPPIANHVVKFTGCISGWYDYWGEYDEDVEIQKVEARYAEVWEL